MNPIQRFLVCCKHFKSISNCLKNNPVLLRMKDSFFLWFMKDKFNLFDEILSFIRLMKDRFTLFREDFVLHPANEGPFHPFSMVFCPSFSLSIIDFHGKNESHKDSPLHLN